MVSKNRRVIIRKVAKDAGIAILLDVLRIKHVAAKFIPKLLNFKQKQRRINIAQELLNDFNIDPDELARKLDFEIKS